MQKLLIFPYNGNAIEAADCVGSSYELIGFIDDTPEKQGKQANGYEVFSRDALTRYAEAKVLAVPGSPSTYLQRKNVIDSLGIPPGRFAAVIHPSARVCPMAKIGHNVLLMAGVVITSNAVIGNHVCVLPNTVIHHDVTVGDYTLIGSNITIAGHTKIGKNCYIGSGSNIINNVEIGDNTLVGLGSNVIKSIPPNAKAAGNPAKVI